MTDISAAERNIVLIGMPGSGKSTVGVLLAKATNRRFLDTDVYIQAHEGRSLQEIIDAEGTDAFKGVEQRYVSELDVRGHVVATGGSVVYSEAAMRNLAATGTVVHLDLPLAAIEQRINNLYTRGLVMGPGQTLRDLYAERDPLYRRWAEVAVDCQGLTQEQVVEAIIAAVPGACG